MNPYSYDLKACANILDDNFSFHNVQMVIEELEVILNKLIKERDVMKEKK